MQYFEMLSVKPANRWKTRLIWPIVVVLALIAYLVMLHVEETHGRFLPGARTLVDPHDIGVYFRIASFYPSDRTPYVDVSSEYPTLSTLSFATPHLLDSDLGAQEYRRIWTHLMALLFLGVLMLLYRARVGGGLGQWPLVVMASPSMLYFALMRFDILPAFICCLSLYLFGKRSYVWAYVLLAIGVHVKWYPAVIVPVYLAYHMHQDGLSVRRVRDLLSSNSLRYALAFVVAVLALVFVSVLAYGWDGFMVPYRYHSLRGGQYFNPYWLVEMGLDEFGLRKTRLANVVDFGFLLAQLAIIPILLFKRLNTHHQVFQYSILAVVLFVAFAKVDSPQWILWYVPMALMFVRRKETVYALLALTLLNYLVFPIGYDNLFAEAKGAQAWFATLFSWIVAIKDIALVLFVWFLFTREVEPPGDELAAGA